MKKIKRHVVFWSIAGVLLLLIVGFKDGQVWTTFNFVAFLLPVAGLTSYVFNYFLFPRYLYKKRYAAFALYGGLTFVISIYLTIMIILGILVSSGNYTFNNLPFEASEVRFIGISLYFIIALSSILHLIRHESDPTANGEQVLLVKSDRKIKRLILDDIRMIESLSDYVKIHGKDEVIVTKEKISGLAERLPENFIRVHRSFIVNKAFIKSYTKEKIELGEVLVPISRTFKKEALSSLA